MELLNDMAAADISKDSHGIISQINSVPEGKFHGFYSVAYHKIIQLIESGSFGEANRLLKIVIDNKLPTDFIPSDNDLDCDIIDAIFDASKLGTQRENTSLFLVERAFSGKNYQQLSVGRSILMETCPWLEHEISNLVKHLIFFKCIAAENRQMLSFTASHLQGVILINGGVRRDWIFLLDKWVHEGAHAYLFAIDFTTGLVWNDGAKIYPSPLRQDKRTMLGVYHATFVLQRLIYAFSTVSKHPLAADDHAKIKDMIKAYCLRHDDGMATIRMHADLSPTARDLIEEGCACVVAVQR